MKKLITLLTLLVVAVTGAWADDVLCSAQVPTGQEGTFSNTDGLSQTNCTLYYSGLQAGSNVVTVGGVDYYKLGSNSAYVQLKLQEGSFQVGDVLIATVTSNGGSSAKTVNIKVNSHNSGTVSVKSTETKNINYTLVAGDIESDGSIKIYRGSSNSSNLRVAVFSVTGTRKTVATQAYAGVKKGTTTLTEGVDFTKSENTITLTNAYKTTTAPTDVKLINHKTFTDSSTEDEDVDVVFGATASEGYFTGTATIALTTYTVKVPHDNTPSLVADKANVTVTSAKIATGTAKIHLSGVNLAGANVTLAFASAVEGLSIDKTSVAITEGAVDTDVTISYQSDIDVAEANVNLTISTTGVSDIVIPVTYSSTAAVTTIADVTEGIVWDFANAGEDNNIASPDQNNNVPFANADGFKKGFGYDKLSGKGQYFYYKDNKCYQGSQLKFHTTVPGNIVVEFSNTGSSDRPYRYLSVNGVVTKYKSKSTGKETTEAIKVPAGDVNIVGIMGSTSGDDCVPTEDENMLRIYKVTFTPDVIVTSAGWATTTTPSYAVDFDENAEVYIATAVGENITLTKITEAPANTPIVVNAPAGSYTMTKKAEATTDVSKNLLLSSDGSITSESAATDKRIYVLGKDSHDVIGFGPLASGITLAAGKAYMEIADAAAKDFLPFVIGDEESETTSINSIENGESRIENSDYIYNLAGQKVSKDYKGIVIVNGKKVIRK